MDRLTGKRALVTGGSRGIGAAIVRRPAAEGAAVAVNYRSSQDAAEALAKELSADGGRAVALQADVSDPAASRALVARTVELLGGLDILISKRRRGVLRCARVDHGRRLRAGVRHQRGRAAVRGAGGRRGDG